MTKNYLIKIETSYNLPKYEICNFEHSEIVDYFANIAKIEKNVFFIWNKKLAKENKCIIITCKETKVIFYDKNRDSNIMLFFENKPYYIG